MSTPITFPFNGGRDLSQYKKALPPGTRLRLQWNDCAVFEAVIVEHSPGAYKEEMCFCVTKILEQLRYGLYIKMAPVDVYKRTRPYDEYPVYIIATDIQVLGYIKRKVGKFIAE